MSDGVNSNGEGKRRAGCEGIHGDDGGEDKRSICIRLHVGDIGGECSNISAVLAQRVGVGLDERRLGECDLRLREELRQQQKQ